MSMMRTRMPTAPKTRARVSGKAESSRHNEGERGRGSVKPQQLVINY